MSVMVVKRKTNGSSTAVSKLANEFEFLVRQHFAKALERINPQHVVKLALKTIKVNPKLEKCDRLSFLHALVEAAELGLDPTGTLGEAYLVPYRDRVELLIGYKGYIKLAYAAGVKFIEAYVVHENDEYYCRLGSSSEVWHIPNFKNRGEKLFAYAKAILPDGTEVYEVMTKEEIEQVKKHALSRVEKPEYSPWTTHEEEMWKKTVIRRLCKKLPLASAAIEKAIARDEVLEEGEIVDAETGEIIEPEPEDIYSEIKALREELGLTPEQLPVVCKSIGIEEVNKPKDIMKLSPEKLALLRDELLRRLEQKGAKEVAHA